MEVTIKEAKDPLVNMLGAGSLVQGKEAVEKYFAGSVVEGDFLVARPVKTEELQRLISYARDTAIPVYTLKDRYLPEWVSGEQGIILDTSLMKSIEKIDIHALSVNVGPGVTYTELSKELLRYGLKILMPAVSTSSYVAGNAVNRVLLQAACRYPDTQFSNLAVVLADGTLFKTGSHALSEEYADWKDIAGPHLEKWFHASEEMYGVVARATIWTYPRMEGREAGLFHFGDRDKMFGFLKEISRKEFCQEAIGLNTAAASRLLERDVGGGWYALAGHESFPEHVAYQQRKIAETAAAWEGRKYEAPGDLLLEKLETPWVYDPTGHFGFYSLYSRVAELDNFLEDRFTSKKEEKIEKIFVSVSLGRSIYAGYGIPGLDQVRYRDTAVEASRLGAFFNRPLGTFAGYYYPKTTYYLNLMRRVKKMLDPQGILNPHQPYRGWNE